MAANPQGNRRGRARGKTTVTLNAKERNAVLEEFIIKDYRRATDALDTAADTGLLANVDHARAELAHADARLAVLRAPGPEFDIDPESVRTRIYDALTDQFTTGRPANPADAQAETKYVTLYAGILDRVGWPDSNATA